MPEYFAKSPYSSSSSKKIRNLLNNSTRIQQPTAVLFLERGSTPARAREILGHQYLFAIIPVSSLYFQRGAEVFLDELAAEVLSSLGFDVFLAAEQRKSEVLEMLQPKLAISVQFEDLSLSAFDALFFRISSLTARLMLRVYDQSASRDLNHEQIELEISKQEYSRYAFAPFLSDFLRREVHEALGDPLRGKASRLKQGRSLAVKQRELKAATLMISPLDWSDSSLEGLGQLVANSYGFPGQPPFSAGQLSRLLQRGMFAAASELGFLTLQSLEPVKGSSLFIPGLWNLRALVLGAEQVPIEDDDSGAQAFRLKIAVKLQEKGEVQDTLLQSCLCEAEQIIEDNKVDGAVAAALEELGRMVTKCVLSGTKPDEAGQSDSKLRCSC
jgi:hypothetical protein